MTALYELSHQYQDLQALADTADEGMSLAVRDTLEGLTGAIEQKAQAIISLALNMDADVGAIDKEIARLSDRKRAINERQKQLKDYLRDNMEATGITKISCPLFTITCAKGREVAIVDDEKALPDDYVRVKTEIVPDKNAISAALKDGKAVPGARLERGKSSIRIK